MEMVGRNFFNSAISLVSRALRKKIGVTLNFFYSKCVIVLKRSVSLRYKSNHNMRQIDDLKTAVVYRASINRGEDIAVSIKTDGDLWLDMTLPIEFYDIVGENGGNFTAVEQSGDYARYIEPTTDWQQDAAGDYYDEQKVAEAVAAQLRAMADAIVKNAPNKYDTWE